jgi:EmrB/QacA subfamily drug resistance transporter
MTGRKLMYISGFALFGLFSALCGLAPSLPWLIAFRVLQGLSGALLGANSVVILVAAAGPARRGRAMGIFAGAQAVGVCAGPALGGMLLGSLSWHWIFWVTVPFAVLGATLGWLLVPATTKASVPTTFDWPGALLLIPALTALLLALTKVSAWGPSSLALVACAACASILMAAFFWRERRCSAPLMELSLFGSRTFAGGTLAVLMSYAMLYGMFFALSFALVRGYHDAPLAAGLRLTLVPLALGLVAPLSGRLAERRPRLVMISGMGLCVVSALALRQVLTGTPDSQLAMMYALVAYGVGLGLFIAPNSSATLDAAPAEHAGQAGGLLNLMRAFGTATGIAAASTLLAWRLEPASGPRGGTTGVSEDALLGAVRDVMLLLVAFAVIAGIGSSLRERKAAAR